MIKFVINILQKTIIDFVLIYTKGISDIEYIITPFAFLITISEALHCMKTPYCVLICSAGHYKETQKGAFVEAGVNIVLSVVLVCCFGISGVVVATIIATCIRIFDLVLISGTDAADELRAGACGEDICLSDLRYG